jgi:hypothetical protein
VRLSDNDASYIAAHAADTAVELIDDVFDRPLDPVEYERLADDLSEGFRRVLRAADVIV